MSHERALCKLCSPEERNDLNVKSPSTRVDAYASTRRRLCTLKSFIVINLKMLPTHLLFNLCRWLSKKMNGGYKYPKIALK